MRKTFSVAAVAIVAFITPAATAQPAVGQASSSAVIWRDAGKVAVHDLLYGPGGRDRQPRGPFRFIKEDMGGSSPKFSVRDGAGVEWNVKLGEEARAETAATRLLWLAGYFTDEAYLVPVLRVSGMPRLRRGQRLVMANGSMRNARLERSPAGAKRIGHWSWHGGPFDGTREMNALRVMMALLNNWDLKDSNTAVYAKQEPNRLIHLYAVSDAGASFGASGYSIISKKGDTEAYARSRFITQVTPEEVDFGTPSRPALVSIFALPHAIYYARRFRQLSIGDDVPRQHVQWLARILARISPQQTRSVFEAAGYSPSEVEILSEIVQDRIGQLTELESRVAAAQSR
jgi:hypothetical protein